MNPGEVFSKWIIPAWAGNTTVTSFAKFVGSDHPRVGGEHGFWNR